MGQSRCGDSVLYKVANADRTITCFITQRQESPASFLHYCIHTIIDVIKGQVMSFIHFISRTFDMKHSKPDTTTYFHSTLGPN